ncbi:SRPBCC family protein [Zafaria sp. Z1313]|uniref:SRPBCC family protein n=1 Tax=Zafaria sp. Z1313 TaxID=3423202 RepID=UPI003D303BBD
MADGTLVMERDFDAPREKVWEAWTDPDALAAWFGPEGWSVTAGSVMVEPRPGGVWRLVMASDEDPLSVSPIEAELGAFEPPSLLVGRTAATPESGGQVMELRVELEESGRGTRMRLSQGPYPEEVLEMAGGGWEQSFAKLERLLARG